MRDRVFVFPVRSLRAWVFVEVMLVLVYWACRLLPLAACGGGGGGGGSSADPTPPSPPSGGGPQPPSPPAGPSFGLFIEGETPGRSAWRSGESVRWTITLGESCAG